MRDAGEVVHANVLRYRDGRSKGCGVVEFVTSEEARYAIDRLTHTELDGRPIFVREDREEKGANHVATEPGCKLYVGNLSFEVRWEDLKDHFCKIGEVEWADVAEFRDGKKRGYGFVRYRRAEDATRAVEEFKGSEFMGRPLDVSLHVENRSRKAPIGEREGVGL